VNAEQKTNSPSRPTARLALLSGPLDTRGTGAPSARLLGLLLITLVVLFAITPPAARAEQARLFAGTFGTATSTPANPYPLSASYLAADQESHDVYVTDAGQNRVEKFDAGGHFLYMLGTDVNKTAVEAARPEAEQDLCPAPGHPADICQPGSVGLSSVAVDNSGVPGRQGDLYVATESSGVVRKYDPSGGLIESWAEGGELTGASVTDPPAPVAGPFGRVGGLAVDPAGNLWVGDSSGQKMFEFGPDASFVTGWHAGIAGANSGIAVDSEDDVYISNSGGEVTKYDPSGKEIGVVAPSKAEIEAHGSFRVGFPAVDPVGNELFIDGTEGHLPSETGVVRRYDPSSCHPTITEENPQPGCAAAESFGSGLIHPQPQGIAIDPASQALYVAEGESGVAVFSLQTVPGVVTTRPASPTHTTATLTGTVDPAGIELNPGTEGCRFEWGETTAYGHIAPCDKTATQIGAGNSPVEVRAEISGLEAGKTYHYRLVASNPNDENGSVHQPSLGQDLAFGPPLVASASALTVATTAADLQAQVNPQNLDTRVRIEYVSQAQFEATGFAAAASTPAQDIGFGGTLQSPSFELAGLVPATVYRYRVVAANILGEGAEAAVGAEASLTTQTPLPLALPDARGWELVSPPDKLGAKIEPIEETGVVQAAASGDAVTYLAAGPTEGEPQGYSNDAQILSSRGASGWSSRDIGIPHAAATGFSVGQGKEYKFFDPELTAAVVQPFGEFDPGLSTEASEPTAYLHDLGSACGSTCYRPLVTGKEGFANVSPPGVPFGEVGENCRVGLNIAVSVACGPRFLGASEDLDHVVLLSTAPLVEGAGERQLYEWSAGQLTHVSVLPGGEPAVGPTLGLAEHRTPGAISADGTHVFWDAAAAGATSLYLRDIEPGHEQTIQLDAQEAGCGPCKSGAGRFQFASADGSRVFFTDVNRLTADAGAGGAKADLYECRIVEAGEEELACELTDLTPKAGSESAAVQGSILGASEDGSYLYFAATGVLAHNLVENGAGPETAQPGRPNLYLLHEGTTTFLAGLSAEDENDWALQPWSQPTRVSPDGRWLELMAQHSLTGYDDRDVATGEPVAEVYLFHAAAGEGGAGRLVCASCDPTGARPRGVEYEKLEPGSGGLVGGPREVWGRGGRRGELVAAIVPGWTGLGAERSGSSYQDRYLSNSGRLFFDANDALVPQDSNGTFDVYQYEPPQGPEAPPDDSCATTSPTYNPGSGGCVDLISAGTSGTESAFLDASESGSDVFFLTASRLSPRDTDTALDVYDARVGGGEPEAAKPVECQGDSCQNPATPPVDATPGSLTFSGAGNLVECPKGEQLKGDRCVKQQAKKDSKKSKRHQSAKNKSSHRKSNGKGKKQKRTNSKHGGHK
jgi:hypothetical protein